jgi:hypothetical protein
MGFISDILFGQQLKPRVTKEEWKKVRSNLYDSHHFTTIELDKAEEIFNADMYETRKIDNGIDTDEIVRGIQYMRDHVDVHHISIEKINALEEEMMKYIALS